MNIITQKILFVLAGAALVFGGFAVWSPGTFGFCETVRVGHNPTFGKIEFCEGNNLENIVNYSAPMLDNGLAILAISLFALFLPARFYPRFRNFFLLVILSAGLFIYLIPDFNVSYGAVFDVTARNFIAWRWILLGGALALVYSFTRSYLDTRKKQKEI